MGAIIVHENRTPDTVVTSCWNILSLNSDKPIEANFGLKVSERR